MKEHLWVNIYNLDSFKMTQSTCYPFDAAKETRLGKPQSPPTGSSEQAVGSLCERIEIYDKYCPGYNPTSTSFSKDENYDFVVNGQAYDDRVPWFQRGCFLVL